MLICITANKDAHIFAYTPLLGYYFEKRLACEKHFALADWRISPLFGDLMDQAVSFAARLGSNKKNLQKYLQVLSFVARRGIEPLFQE